MTFDVVPTRLVTAESAQSPASDQPDLATLVIELFVEGTLSFQQLRSLAHLPELAAHLASAIATAPLVRKAPA